MIDGEGERGDTRYRVLGLPEKGCFPEARGAGPAGKRVAGIEPA
jgi:hypothetical protein